MNSLNCIMKLFFNFQRSIEFNLKTQIKMVD